MPTNVKIKSDDPMEILANPNVTTILPPSGNNDVIFNNDDVDFNVDLSQIVWDDDNKDLVPFEFDNGKVVMTDDGDVILIDPDNMQVEEKPIVSLSDEVVMLPPEEDMTDVVSTRNIVLKRKQPNNEMGQIKKIKDETNISVRDVPENNDLVVALPKSEDVIKHPIFRKMEKDKNKTDKLAKILSTCRPIVINLEDDLPALEASPTLRAIKPPEPDILANVDVSTMKRLPWIDFKTVLDNTKSWRREQVILDILQANMPSSGDNIYYIDHDLQTNTWSIKVDESSDEIQDFVESILVINAQLKMQDLSAKEKNRLIRKKKLKIKELRKTYGATEAADVLENKLLQVKKKKLKKK